MENEDEADEGSYTTSNDTLNELLETQDIIISDLRDEIKVLTVRINTLKAAIRTQLPFHLTEIIENL